MVDKNNNNSKPINQLLLEEVESISKIGLYQWDIKKNKIINFTQGAYNILENNDIHYIEDITKFMIANDKTIYNTSIKTLLNNPDAISKTFKHIINLGNNNKKFVSHTIKIIKNNNNGDIIILGLIQDITERYNFEKEISKKAYFDLLTDLPNRAGFEKSFNKSLMLAKNIHNLALLFIDLDDFKKINDTMGHNMGDKLLRHITSIIQKTSSEYKDAYSDSDYIFSKITPARFGGDEFIISFPYGDDFSLVENYTKELLNKINKRIKIKGNEIKPSVSIGVSRFPQDGQNFMSLLKKSDLAMYRAKNNNKNTYSIYSSDMSDSATNKLQIESDLFDALKNNELVLYYQPKINLFTGKVDSYESLIRWNHPKKGLLFPGKFIDIAEESDLIYEITDWVIEQCLRDHMKYFIDKDVDVAINLSAKQFNTNLLSHKIFNLDSKKIDPRKFEFEVTENILIDNIDQTINMLQIIKNKGFKTAIDDFGSGYSSFSYIKNLPVNTLKLDKIFIDNLADAKDRAIISSIVYLAHELNLKSVCEGVEELYQLDYLLDIKCSHAQGFLMSEAVKLEDLESEAYKNQINIITNHIKKFHKMKRKVIKA